MGDIAPCLCEACPAPRTVIIHILLMSSSSPSLDAAGTYTTEDQDESWCVVTQLSDGTKQVVDEYRERRTFWTMRETKTHKKAAADPVECVLSLLISLRESETSNLTDTSSSRFEYFLRPQRS